MVTRRSGLGRGLDALIPSDAYGSLESPGGLLEVEIARIDPNPNQPRHTFDDDAIAELAASVAQLGILQPLLVRERAGGRYELIAGERRLRAARAAELERVPVVVVETDEQGSLERALVENIHRSDLNPIEEAAGYRQLIDEGGSTHEVVAERVGKNRVSVTNALRLLDLPTPVQKLMIERKLSAGHGRSLLGLENSPFQERLARRAAQEGLSVRETEDLVRRYQSMSGAATRSSGPTTRERPPLAAEAQRRLSDHLQTRVRVDVGARKGKIVIDFVSLEELDRILRTALGETPGATSHTVSLDEG